MSRPSVHRVSPSPIFTVSSPGLPQHIGIRFCMLMSPTSSAFEARKLLRYSNESDLGAGECHIISQCAQDRALDPTDVLLSKNKSICFPDVAQQVSGAHLGSRGVHSRATGTWFQMLPTSSIRDRSSISLPGAISRPMSPAQYPADCMCQQTHPQYSPTEHLSVWQCLLLRI